MRAVPDNISWNPLCFLLLVLFVLHQPFDATATTTTWRSLVNLHRSTYRKRSISLSCLLEANLKRFCDASWKYNRLFPLLLGGFNWINSRSCCFHCRARLLSTLRSLPGLNQLKKKKSAILSYNKGAKCFELKPRQKQWRLSAAGVLSSRSSHHGLWIMYDLPPPLPLPLSPLGTSQAAPLIMRRHAETYHIFPPPPPPSTSPAASWEKHASRPSVRSSRLKLTFSNRRRGDETRRFVAPPAPQRNRKCNQQWPVPDSAGPAEILHVPWAASGGSCARNGGTRSR